MLTEWKRNQANRITFVMVNAANTEVAGLGAGFTLEISKNGAAFVASAGTKTEISNGWYSYLATASEADTVGPVSIRVTGAGAIQQNLEYVVVQRTSGAIEFTYTVLDTLAAPIEGAQVCITTDIGGSNTIWNGTTDALGVARDVNSEKPFLDTGTYYFWSQKVNYSFPNPD